MALNFKELKKNRTSSFEKLNAEVTKLNSKSFDKSDDDRFWKPTVEKDGTGFAIIRFLPEPAGEDVPFIRMFDHGFQGPGGWYIENSLTTIGEKDPVGEYNSQLWNSTTDDEAPARKQARSRKRRLSYIANIYVVQDSKNPENEGKVFLFKFGKKIFDKLNEMMNPEFEDETPTNPFDLYEGANFKLKIRNVEGYRNYDKSEFDKPSPLSTDEEKLEQIWTSEHKLQPFLDKKNFKSYEELEKKLYKVLGIDKDGKPTPAASRQTAADRVKEEIPEAQPRAQKESRVESDDDDVNFFANLAQDD